MYLQEIMTDYLNQDSKALVVENSFNPIRPKVSTWIYEEKRVVKSYDFEESRFVEAFIVQILKYIRESDAIIEFRVKELKVGIIIHALSPSISEIEIEATKDVDKIKKDVMYYYAR